MTPLLIVKTANGFALVEYTGDIPPVDLSTVLTFGELDGSYRYDGAFHAIRQHFTTPCKEAA